MPRGDKSKYTAKQKRQAEHIEEGYEKKGVSEAERRAWATVNKEYWRRQKRRFGQKKITPDFGGGAEVNKKIGFTSYASMFDSAECEASENHWSRREKN